MLLLLFLWVITIVESLPYQNKKIYDGNFNRDYNKEFPIVKETFISGKTVKMFANSTTNYISYRLDNPDLDADRVLFFTPGRVFVNGDFAYVYDGYNGLFIVNYTSDPTNPVIVGKYISNDLTPCGSHCGDVYVVGDLAFIADAVSGGGLTILNISSKTNISFVSSVKHEDYKFDLVQIEMDFAYLFERHNRRLRIIDITNIHTPYEAGSYSFSKVINYARVGGGLAFVAAKDGFHIIDVTMVSSPYEIGFLPMINAYHVLLDDFGNYTYVFGPWNDVGTQRGSIWTVDIKNKTSPRICGNVSLSFILNEGNYHEFRNNRLYVSGFTNGLTIVNVEDPLNPIIGGHSSIYVSDVSYRFAKDNYLAAVDYYKGGFNVFEMNGDSLNLKGGLEGTVEEPIEMVQYDKFVYILTKTNQDAGTKIYCIDISKTPPSIVHDIKTPHFGTFSLFASNDGYLYVGFTNGLNIYKIKENGTVEFQGGTVIGIKPFSISCLEFRCFALVDESSDKKVVMIDVSDKKSPLQDPNYFPADDSCLDISKCKLAAYPKNPNCTAVVSTTGVLMYDFFKLEMFLYLDFSNPDKWGNVIKIIDDIAYIGYPACAETIGCKGGLIIIDLEKEEILGSSSQFEINSLSVSDDRSYVYGIGNGGFSVFKISESGVPTQMSHTPFFYSKHLFVDKNVAYVSGDWGLRMYISDINVFVSSSSSFLCGNLTYDVWAEDESGSVFSKSVLYENELDVCSSHGICYQNQQCFCSIGYDSSDEQHSRCDLFTCYGIVSSKTDEVCSGMGECTELNFCACKNDFGGERCETWSCGADYKFTELTCSGNGQCTAPSTCSCNFGYSGRVCSNNMMYYTIMTPSLTVGSLLFIFLACSCLLVCCYVVCLVCCSGLVIFFLSLCGLSSVVFKQTRGIKKFKKLRNFDMYLEEQKLEDNTSVGHLRIKKELFEINMDEIVLLKNIGEGGSSSTVYQAKWNNQVVAFKCFRTREICGNQESFDEFEREVSILGSVAHPFILQFYGCSLKPPRVGIVMEFCENGDLQYYLRKYEAENSERVPISEKFRLMNEVVLAMSYLHSRNIIHRDMKLENVLVDSNEQCKVMDFGLSKIVERMSQKKTTRIGTSIYMAPELIFDGSYDEKVDVFSFAIMMFIIMSEEFSPYGTELLSIEMKVANDPNLRPKLSVMKEEVPPEHFSWLEPLVRKSWSHKSEERPSFSEISEVFGKSIGELLNNEDRIKKEKRKNKNRLKIGGGGGSFMSGSKSTPVGNRVGVREEVEQEKYLELKNEIEGKNKEIERLLSRINGLEQEVEKLRKV